MSVIKEFKEFAMRGNVVDLAIGVVIGTAFGKIVSSLVSDVIMPPVGVLTGGVDFSNLSVTLKETSNATAAVTLNYGVFLNAVIDFAIVAFAIFMVVKGMNNLRRKAEKTKEEEPTTKACPFCISTIPVKATRCAQCTADLPI